MNKHNRLINLTISYQTEPNLVNPSFLSLSSIGKNWKAQPRATLKIPVFNPCVNWGKIMYSLAPTLKKNGKTEKIYIK